MYHEILTIDTESTGPNPLSDRLLTIYVGVLKEDGEWVGHKHLLFNPGIPVPAEAANIHGISTETAVAYGIQEEEHKKAWEFLRELILKGVNERKIPMVAYNAVFDCTLINQELKRVGLEPIDWEDMLVIDPLVLDKYIDKWRKGSRKLVDTAPAYGIEVDHTKAHDASYDCYLAGSIALSPKFQEHEMLRDLSPKDLMILQKQCKVEQAESLQKYLREKQGKPDLIVDPAWPERFVDIETS